MAASARLPVASAAQARKRATPSTASATRQGRQEEAQHQPPAIAVGDRPGAGQGQRLVADRGRREDQLQAHGDVDAGDHQSGTRSRLSPPPSGSAPAVGRSARGHQQEGQRDHADHEGQDDGEHEVADDPRIDRGEPGGERLVLQDVAVPGDRDRRSTDGDHEVGGGTEQRRRCAPASAAPSSAAARGRPPAAGPARWRGRRDRRGGRGARTGACSCGSIRRWRQDGLARVASAVEP